MARIRVGISGWRYAPWRGSFYPEKLPQSQELAFAAAHFPVLELNGSFYSLQRPSSYTAWYRQTPADFVFSIKAPRYITHIRRLRDIEAPMAKFFASGLLRLKEKLGSILWQFPPNFTFEPERMRRLLALLPHDTAASASLARRREDWMAGRVALKSDAKRRVRHAIEVRHASFVDAQFVELLRDYDVACVVAESARHWPMIHEVTSDFVYLRLHGDKQLYRGGYGDAALSRWARRIATWAAGREPRMAGRLSKAAVAVNARDVFCFFDNTDIKLRAPFDAQTLMRKLKLKR